MKTEKWLQCYGLNWSGSDCTSKADVLLVFNFPGMINENFNRCWDLSCRTTGIKMFEVFQISKLSSVEWGHSDLSEN
jgi:hypothetical protein